MGWEDLGSAKPPEQARVYLDTSALYALTHRLAGKTTVAWVDAEEAEVGRVIHEWLGALRSGKGTAWVTPFQFQEIAATTINRRRNAELKAANYTKGWSHFRKEFEVRAAEVDTDANAKTIEFLGWAVNACNASGIGVARPCVLTGKEEQRAKEIRLAHRKILLENVGLDSMDAMHLAIGAEMGIRHFLTLDRGWTAVKQVSGYLATRTRKH